MTITPPLVWISSYPKSGNTWVRNFLYRYLWGEPRVNIGKRSLAIDRIVRESGADGARESLVAAHAEAVHSVWPPEISEHLLVKTHYEWSPAHPVADDGRMTLLIVRDPRDVMLSAMNFREMRSRSNASSAHEYVESFIATLGDPGYFKRGYGTWLSHPLSWISQSTTDSPVAVVGYRSLLEEPVETFAAVTRSIFGSLDESRLEVAIEGSSFRNLREREIERKEKRGETTDKLFFNSGTAGRTIHDTTGVAGLDHEFDAVFGAQVEQLREAIDANPTVLDLGTKL